MQKLKPAIGFLKRFFFDFLCVKIVKFFFENVSFRMHCIHNYSLIMKLTSCFVSIKLKHYSKLENENIKLRRIRNKLTRVIINNHEQLNILLFKISCLIICLFFLNFNSFQVSAGKKDKISITQRKILYQIGIHNLSCFYVRMCMSYEDPFLINSDLVYFLFYKTTI